MGLAQDNLLSSRARSFAAVCQGHHSRTPEIEMSRFPSLEYRGGEKGLKWAELSGGEGGLRAQDHAHPRLLTGGAGPE